MARRTDRTTKRATDPCPLHGLVIADVAGGGEEANMPIPDRFGELIDRVMERDRRYFETEGARRYTRPSVLGEAWPVFGDPDLLVTVYRVRPGMRFRLFHRADEIPPATIPFHSLRGVSDLGKEVDERIRRG